MSDVLRFLTPNGSLSERLRMYLAKAGYDVDKPDPKGCCGSSQDGRIMIIERDRRMIPHLVAGSYDAGITGLDLLINSRAEELRTVANLCFAKRTDRPTRWVLAAKEMGDFSRRVRIGTELVHLPQLILPSLPFTIHNYEVVKLEGNEEMAIEDGLCDIILVVTETGRAIQEAGLQVLPGCENLLESVPQIIAKLQLPPGKERALQEIRFALDAVIGAATRRMMKFDLPTSSLATLQLPAEVAPTASDLVGRPGWVAVEICVPRWEVDSIGLRVRDAGARAIVIQEVIGFSP